MIYDTKNKTLTVRVTKKEDKEVKAKAREKRKSVSEFIRHKIFEPDNDLRSITHPNINI